MSESITKERIEELRAICDLPGAQGLHFTPVTFVAFKEIAALLDLASRTLERDEFNARFANRQNRVPYEAPTDWYEDIGHERLAPPKEKQDEKD